MVAPQEEKVVCKFHLVGQQAANCLKALLSSIHIVTQEEVVRLRRKATTFEQLEKIRVLSMDIPADLQRNAQLQEDGLLHEDLPGKEA